MFTEWEGARCGRGCGDTVFSAICRRGFVLRIKATLSKISRHLSSYTGDKTRPHTHKHQSPSPLMLQKLNHKLHGRARVLVLDGVPILQVHIISQNARRRQAMDDTVHAMRITKRHGPLGIHRNGDMLSPSRCRA